MLNMSTLYERLIEICRDQGIEAPIGRDIELVAGVSSGRVTQIKHEREAARLGSKAIQKLTGLGYLADWLQEGRGLKHITRSRADLSPNPVDLPTPSPSIWEQNESNTEPGPGLSGKVPLISWVQAGAWSHVIDLLQPGEAFEWIDTTVTVQAHTFALRVTGDSMEPDFPAGMILVVEPEMDAHPGDFVIVKNGDDEATFKQLVRDGADLYLKPLNQRYPIKPLGSSRIVGVVREAVRKLR